MTDHATHIPRNSIIFRTAPRLRWIKQLTKIVKSVGEGETARIRTSIDQTERCVLLPAKRIAARRTPKRLRNHLRHVFHTELAMAS